MTGPEGRELHVACVEEFEVALSNEKRRVGVSSQARPVVA
jgi:hypothetical protein